MECKNCKELMELDETGDEDGMVYHIYKCENCGYGAKVWWSLEISDADNISWVDKKGENADD